jgi:hypothetical protein
MLAVRIEPDLILLLVRSYFVNNPASDNWAIIRYRGVPPEEPVWTRGELPEVDIRQPVMTREILDVINSLRDPTAQRLHDTLLARFPLTTMRIHCARIKPGALDYCWVGNIRNDQKLRPTRLDEERWMFKPWDAAQFNNPQRKKAREQRPLTISPQQHHGRDRQPDPKPTGTC